MRQQQRPILNRRAWAGSCSSAESAAVRPSAELPSVTCILLVSATATSSGGVLARSEGTRKLAEQERDEAG